MRDYHLWTAEPRPDTPYVLDLCVRCDPYGFGPLCEEHREEVTRG